MKKYDFNSDINSFDKETLEKCLLAYDSYRRALYDSFQQIKSNHHTTMKFHDERARKVREKLDELEKKDK